MESILDYFENTVTRFPDREAVDDGSCCYSWKEFYLLTERIATAVASESQPGMPIPVFMEKKADVAAAFLGIVSAGCFYVYLNPELPNIRIAKMLEILKTDTAIVQENLMARLYACDFAGSAIGIQEAKKTKPDSFLLKKRRAGISNRQYLYGIFTSGSTGVPKNVVVSHQAVLDFMKDFRNEFPVSAGDVLANQAPFDFDVSVKDIYLSLFTGAKLVLIPRRMFVEPALLLDYLCEKKATVLIWAASALCMISGLKGFEYRIPEAVRLVMFSGEVMPMRHLRIWMDAIPGAEFVNLYGPTEVTCNCTYYRVAGREADEDGLPIGIPFAKRIVFLLDSCDTPIFKDSVRGEICVGGSGLASGYYKNPKETKKRFVRSPVKSHGGKPIYRTGDMGYYDQRGNLYFAGRLDNQIKHMGHRIELEEIERECMKQKGIGQVCCIYRRGKLILFYAETNERIQEGLQESLWTSLRESLPDYMIPNRMIRLDRMPLNKNGKIDRQRLATWEGGTGFDG